MDLILIRLTPPTVARLPERQFSPEAVIDILWANAGADDRLEHIRAREGPAPQSIDVAMFLLPDLLLTNHSADTVVAALRLCRDAIAISPALTGWTATALDGNAITTALLTAALFGLAGHTATILDTSSHTTAAALPDCGNCGTGF